MRGSLTPRRARGFTLLEMLVAMGIMGVVLAAAMGAFLANQKQYVLHAETAGVQATLRVASLQLERALQLTGYGIDPNFALEPWAMGPGGTAVAGGERDGSGPWGSDELVVHYRHPLFGRRLTSASAGSLVFTPPLSAEEALLRGQRLLVLCTAGLEQANASAYVTVQSAATTATETTVTLSVAGSFPFDEQALLDNACFDTGMVMRVERRHFYVAPLRLQVGGPVRPALLMSRGLDMNGDGTVDGRPTDWPAAPPATTASTLGDAELIALDVEQLQVAYVLNQPPAALAASFGINPGSGPDDDGNFVFGDSGAADVPNPETPAWPGSGGGPGSPPLFPIPPLLDTPQLQCFTAEQADSEDHCGYGGKRRYTGHPGNVRTVRFALVARSGPEDMDFAATQPRLDAPADGEGPLENLTSAQLPPASHHRRQRFYGSVALRNMFQRSHFLPPSDASGVYGG
ncbi:MAG: type II secretion system GspH family protein [Myxococcaceae bacterium]|nr:type II secretion system GspH family protein [Myxococcaceae bacterium]MCI0673195.1 type II secretion system GspH family protein [Myxococcaceae bacterium]